MDLPKLTYTIEEAAQILEVPVSSIKWLLRKKVLPHRKIAGRNRFTLQDLLECIERSKVDE
jgi:excisionase family DNA binding protein